MPVKCCVSSCKVQTDAHDVSNISFHRLPARESLREEWIKILKKYCPTMNTKYLFVCSQHFQTDCFQYTGLCKKRMLKNGSVPTIFHDLEIVKCEKQAITSREHDTHQNSFIKSAPCDFFPSTIKDEQNENLEKSFDIKNDCPSTSGIVETLSINRNRDIVLEQKDYEKTTVEKRLRNKIHMLQQKNTSLVKILGRCRKKMYKFKFLFEALRQQKYISDDQSVSLQNTISTEDRKIFERLVHSRRSKVQLPSSLRKFACTLDFYSPKAYNYVRSTFMTTLPHRKTISRWYRKLNIGSGICEAVIAAVKDKVSKSTGPVFCNLVFDEISIKKKLETVNEIEYGYVDIGKGDVADNAIVYMLVCVNGRWKIPISYYFITSLTAKEKRDMVDDTLRSLHGTGVIIVSLTFDGPSSNISMCHLLRADLNIDGEMKNYFYHPITKQPIFIIIDACHSLKSVRNSIAKVDKQIYDDEGIIIAWSFFENLVSVQHTHSELYLAHKMTDNHINWRANIMNVRLAAQTLSRSVSDALTYLEFQTNISNFKGAAATSKFCKIMNDAFDILNSRSRFTKDPCKACIDNDNIQSMENRIKIIVNYIKGMKHGNGERVVDGQRKTGFIGIILGLRSVIGIFKHYVQKQIPNGYLLTYKLSQDHLEVFFSAVRSKGGHCNNPTCRLFISIFKQLVFHADIKGSDKGNCTLLDKTAMLQVSATSVVNSHHISNIIRNGEIIVSTQNENYVHDAVCYTAGFVCRKLLKISKCFICPLVLTHQPELIDNNNNGTALEYRSKLIDIKNRGGLIHPSTDVITICKLTEKIFRKNYVSQKGIFKRLVKLSEQNVPCSCLPIMHPLSEKVNESTHRFILIRKIISLYLQMRINKFEKQKQRPKKQLRRLYTKYILFNHE